MRQGNKTTFVFPFVSVALESVGKYPRRKQGQPSLNPIQFVCAVLSLIMIWLPLDVISSSLCVLFCGES